MIRHILYALSVITLVILSGPVAFSQTQEQPVDPIVRADTVSGQYEVTLGLSYVPDGEEGAYLSQYDVVTFTRSTHQALLPVRVRYFLNQSSSVLLSLNPGLQHSVLAESTAQARNMSLETEASIGASIGVRHRLAPGHTLDPAITVSIDLPSRTADLNLSGSWIRDPVVLSGSLSHALNMGTDTRYVALNLGAGLLLNDKIRFKAGTQHTVRIDDVALPQWGFTGGVVYALDSKGASDLYVGISRTERAGKSTNGFVVEWYRLVGSR